MDGWMGGWKEGGKEGGGFSRADVAEWWSVELLSGAGWLWLHVIYALVGLLNNFG